VQNTLEFPDLVRLIDERSAAFRAAAASAPSLDLQVPTCPEWTLLDLVQHLGAGRGSWAATVAAGPDAEGKAPLGVPPEDPDTASLLAWVADSTTELVEALHDAGPDRGCWTWWGDSQSPKTSGAVARHQLQEIAVHTYDAQLTAGSAQPLPDEVALDGVEEFLVTCCATTSPWPHEPAVVDYHATEGRSWRVWVSSEGAKVARRAPAVSADEALADLSVTGTASDLVLAAFYGRLPLETLEFDGDRAVIDQLIAWDPSV
jgi:uncharacterized protein (TIGR03083 family)